MQSLSSSSPVQLPALRTGSDSLFPVAGSASQARDRRLRKHADYQRVYRSSRKQFSASMTWFLARRADPAAISAAAPRIPDIAGAASGPRVGLTAGKVLGKAHERNRIKRRMREAVRRHIGELPIGFDLILHPKRSVLSMDFAKLDGEVLRIFRQAATLAGAMRPSSDTAQGRA